MSPTRCFCFGRCCPLLGHPPPTQGPTEPPQDTHIPPNGTHSGTRVWHPESSVAPTVAPCVDLPPNLTLLVTPHHTLLVTPHTTQGWSHHTPHTAGHTTHHTPHTAGHNAPHLLRRQHGRTHYVPHTNTGTDQKNIQILDRAQVKYHITNIQKLPAQLLQILYRVVFLTGPPDFQYQND